MPPNKGYYKKKWEAKNPTVTETGVVVPSNSNTANSEDTTTKTYSANDGSLKAWLARGGKGALDWGNITDAEWKTLTSDQLRNIASKIKEPGGAGAGINLASRLEGFANKIEETGANIKNQLKQFNLFMAAGDNDSAQAILDNIKIDDPSYDLTPYQTKISEITNQPTPTPATVQTDNKYSYLPSDVQNKIKDAEGQINTMGSEGVNKVINDIIENYYKTKTEGDSTGTKPVVSPVIDGQEIPTYDPTQDPGYATMQDVKKSYLEQSKQDLGDFVEPELKTEYVAPQLTPEMVQNWDKTLQEWDSVSDTKDDERLIRTLDAQDPYGQGSGDRATRLSALIADRAEARKTRAVGFAEKQLAAETDTAQTQYKQKLAEWEKTYGTAWATYNMKQQEIENSKQKLAEIAEFESNSYKFTNSQEREAAWTALQRKWTERDSALAKQHELEMQGRSIAASKTSQLVSGLQSSGLASQGYYQDINKMNLQNTQDLQTAKIYEDANKKSDWDYIAPIFSTIAGGLTGGLGYGLASGIGSKYLSAKYSGTKTPSYTGETNYTG